MSIQPSLDGKNINMPGTTEGPINIDDLFPGTSAGNTRPPTAYFPDEYTTSVDEYRGVYDSGSSMDNSGGHAQGLLWDDAAKENPTSFQGQAYKIMLDTANRSRPDMRKDPLFNQSQDVVNNMGDWSKEFGDCSTETNFKPSGRPVHVPQYERCERVVDKSAQCEVNHDYEAAVVRHYSGPFNLDSCGDGCTSLWIGRVGDNYWDGWCTIFEQTTTVTVINPEAITSATLEYAKWDDYMQVWVGAEGSEEMVWTGPNGNFPPETEGACELSTSWSRNLNVDVTRFFKDVEPGVPVNFKMRVSVAGSGEGFGRIRISYDPRKAIIKDEWIPENCLDAAVAVEDGFASGSFVCTDDPTTPPNCTVDDFGNYTCDRYPEGWTPGTPFEGCVVINGVKVCEDYLDPSPLDGVSSLCRKVTVDSDYDFYKGQLDCYTDSNGDRQCPVNNGGNLNSCQALENNPECGYIKSECVDGAAGKSGECYVFEDTYDCGYSTNIGSIEKEVEIQCAGPIRCMGTDCLDITYTANNDFAKASAMLNAAQFMAQDMACTGYDDNGNPTGEDNVICSVFPGEAGECKKAVGGVVNCCEKPDGISLVDYITLLMSVPKIDTAIMGLEATNSIRSSYQLLREPITQGFTELSKPFTSALDGVSGAFETVSETYNQVVGLLEDSVAKLYDKVFGNVAEGAGAAIGEIGSGAASEAAQQFVENVGNLIGWVGTVYTVYSVTMLAIKMIWKCTDDEMSVNVKRQLKSCSYVGSYCKTKVLGVCIEKRESYCCFSSPLSRIIQEQARPQLGLTFGSAKNPTCGGISMEQIGDIDWDRINLDEWLGILQSTGHWPNPDEISIDTLTGSGTSFDLGTRVNAEQRAIERIEGTDVDQARYDLSNTYKPFMGGIATP